MKNKVQMGSLLRLAFCAVLTIGMAMPVMAQGSRQHIKDCMRNQGQCRNVAITRTGGDLMLYARNGYCSKNCPSGLVNALSELHDNSEYIDDVQLTENGSWLVLWGDNGVKWHNIPSGLEKKLRQYNDENEVINSATFNDNGDWIVITNTKYSASSTELLEWLSAGEQDHGELWTAHLTNDAVVAVYDRGYRFRGNVPESLKEAARRAEFDVYRLKFAGSAWFIADKQGHYDYNL